EYDYLTVANPGSSAANLTVSYYSGTAPTNRTISVQPHSRHTIQVFNPSEGAGPGLPTIGITLGSSQPVLVEKPTYSTGASYGATDTPGYSPPGGGW
ncbi:MAG TPA: hypothetical protein VG015_09665, partial [Candidatus Dormibacteraeota bacterium]|nr:hypothetical protein [Candidatus Dormibacteraeota bacterium]